MVSATTLPLRVSRRQAWQPLAAIFALNVGFLIATTLKYSNVVRGASWGGWGRAFRLAFDLGAENNLAAWYSAITLLIAAGVWVICYALDVRGRESTGDRILSWGWLLLAALFCLLSLDEEGSFHERLGAVPGLNQFEVFAVPLAAVGIFLLLFAWARLRHSWLAIALLALGFLTYLSVPIQEKAEVVLERTGDYAATWHTPTLDVVIEEGSELLGTLLFIVAGLVHARRLNRAQLPSMPEEQWLDFEISASRRVIAQVVGWVVGLLALGFITVQFIAVPDLPHGSQFKGSQLGNPADWFAGSLMLIAAFLFLYAARAKGEVSGQQLLRSFYKIFAVYALVLAIHHGAGHLFSSIMWDGSPRRQMATNVVLGLAGLAVAGVGIARLTQRPQRLVLAVWGALAVAAAVQPEPAAALLLFAAYGLVLIGVAPVALAPTDLPPPSSRTL